MTNDTTFAIGAFGNSTNVFTPTHLATTAYYDSTGGGYWYRYPSNSFGFADSSTVNLDQCDFGQESPDCLSRLCWHLDKNLGGYRAGCTVGLNRNPDWRKVIYAVNTTYQCIPGTCFVS